MRQERQTAMKMFRELDATEEQEFRAWARANYKPLSPINGVWHTAIQDECRKMNGEVDIGDPDQLIREILGMDAA